MRKAQPFVTYLLTFADAAAEDVRLRDKQKRVLGESYWRTIRPTGQVAFTVQVPTREELYGLNDQPIRP